jgi:hypothetical protein
LWTAIVQTGGPEIDSASASVFFTRDENMIHLSSSLCSAKSVGFVGQ